MGNKSAAGKFIVLDGPDGCGKSTQVKLLAEKIESTGINVAGYRDPGTTSVGEGIRKILLDPSSGDIDVRCEMLLYMAARAQLWAEKISGVLAEGGCVLLDRWLSSTCAYQGYAGGFGIEQVLKIAEDSLERALPDITIILDVDSDTAAERAKSSPDRMEQKSPEYHSKVRQGFLKLPDFRDNIEVISAAGDVQTVHKKILEKLNQRGLI
jgi:dTMP kinase